MPMQLKTSTILPGYVSAKGVPECVSRASLFLAVFSIDRATLRSPSTESLFLPFVLIAVIAEKAVSQR